jgi:hypothetical protein
VPGEIIARNRWREFLEGFSRAHAGWLVTVEAISGRAAPATVVHDVPLIGISDDDGRVVIAMGADNSHSDRIVDEPVNVRVERAPDGTERGLEIENADGDLVRLRFRTPMPPELVDGIV